jgi:hypothetical protein
VELRRDSTTVWQNRERVTLNSESYALNFHPVVARKYLSDFLHLLLLNFTCYTGDTGEYKCLVNDRRLPESILNLVVQGKPTFALFHSVSASVRTAYNEININLTTCRINHQIGQQSLTQM